MTESFSSSPYSRTLASSTENYQRITTGYQPRPLQLELHKKLKRFSVLVMHRRFGKCLDVTTPIPTPDRGYVAMGNLKSGDWVFDEKGKPTRVVAAHPVLYDLKCYELAFSDGSTVVCDEEHLWFTQTKPNRCAPARRKAGSGRKVSNAQGSVKTTREIVETLTYQGESNHRIPTCGPMEYPEKLLPIDPYILGLWLGDGTSRCPQFTTMDPEIVAALQAYADANGLTMKPTNSQNSGKATTYRLNGGLQVILGKAGLLLNKHVPDAYLQGSVAQRLALLQGLMDTDGTISKAGHCDFTQKRPALTRAITSLLSSLGMKFTVSKRKIRGRVYERVTFTPTMNPFRLPKKAARFKEPASVVSHRYITGAKEVPSRPVRCIEVENSSHLFLCTEWNIPTHNTVFSINEMIARGMRCPHPNPRCAYLAPLYSQAKRVAWDYLKQYTSNLPGALPNEADLRVDVPRPAPYNDTVRFTLLGADNPQSLRGIYLDFAILDEYADMNPNVWGEIIRPTLSDRNGRALFIGTPKGRNNFFAMYDRALNGFPKMTDEGEESMEDRKRDPEWFGALYKASETGLLADKELESAKRDMADDDLYEQEYECSFLAGLTGAYYAKQMASVEATGRVRHVPYDPALLVDTWWDLGINDTTAIGFFQTFGNEVRMIDYIEDSGQGLGFYIKKLNALPYTYGTNWLPHDAAARDLSTGKTRIETAKALGLKKIKIVPKLDIEEGIHAVRQMLPRVVFDEKKTRRIRECLIAYQKRWDSKNLIFSSTPLHNWASNGADMFRYFSVSHRDRDYSGKRTLPTHAESSYNVFGS